MKTPEMGPSPKQAGVEDQEGGIEEESEFREQAEVKGITIHSYKDPEYEDYCIYLPGIDLAEGAKKGVADQLIRIDQDPEHAKAAFVKAKELAETEPDIYDLYKKLEAFIQDLREE